MSINYIKIQNVFRKYSVQNPRTPTTATADCRRSASAIQQRSGFQNPGRPPRRLFPGRVDWFTHQKRRVHSRPGLELLHPSVIHFRDVEVAFLVHAKSVNSPEAARKIAPGSEGIEKMSIQVVLEHLGCSPVESPQRAVGPDVNQVNV